MSGTIDERIVEMNFKAEGFVSNVSNAVHGLEQLKNGLNSLKGSDKDINNLDEAGRRFSLSGMAQGISGVTHNFSLMRIAGLTAFTALVRQGLFAGERLLAAFTIDPIKAGLDVYETKINAIQTILANTQAEGTNLKQVTAALNQLNTYANLTVYNFGQMAKNIGTFTAAGVDLKTSVSSIKGIANLAALSGSSAEQASTGMYQLSQAIAAGVVKLQDWNSVVNAGFGGKVFQKALIDTARVNGVSVDAMIKKYGSFRQSLQSGWLSAKILTQTLSQFTGDLSKKQLEAMGFTAQESDAIQKQAKVAVQSATQIRTVSQLMAALKEEVATAWAGIFQAIIGNSKQATVTLSALHNVAESALKAPIIALTNILQSFTNLGGRDVVIQAITTAFHALGEVLGTVKAAFQEVFPPSGGPAGAGLLKLAFALLNFTNKLVPSAKTLSEFKTIFVGLFSAIKIVIDVISALVGGITKVGGATKSAGGGLLAFVATIAHFITNLKNAIESGTALQTFFRVLGDIISVPIKAIGALIGWLGSLGSATGKATSAVSDFVGKIGAEFRNIADLIGKGITSGNFSAVASLLNHLLIGSILLTIKKFIKGLGKGGEGGGGGIFAGIKESLESLTTTLKTMQTNLKANILQKIAIAIAILAASLLLLSFVNVGNLSKAIAAITVMFTELLTAMNFAIKVGGSAGIVKMGAIAASLDLLATALVIMSAAVAILAQFSWEQLAKGLSAIAILLAELVGTALLMSSDSKGLITGASAMIVMAVALNLLAIAVGRLGKLDFGTLAKGVGSIAVLLAILAGFNEISGAQLVTTAAAMVLVGAALVIIAQAVTTLGSLSIGELAKGLIGVAASLLIIAVAMQAMPPSMFITAAGLVLVATALVIMSNALTTLGGMSWSEIAKSLIELAGALTIIAIAVNLMTGALPGAAALIIVAASLAILTPVLVTLGGLSWDAIAKGLVTLAGVFIIIAAAGLLLTPLIPTLLGLGAAIALIGIGILAAGAGVLAFAAGLTALALAVTASGAAILSFVTSILDLIPLTLTKIGEGIVAFATAIANGATAIGKAFVAIADAVLNAIIKIAPKAGQAFGAVMDAILGAINKNAPHIINTMGNLIVSILNGLNKYLPRFLNAGTNLVVNLLNGISSRIGRIISAGTNLVVNFINGIGSAVGRVVSAGVNMVIRTVNAVADKIRGSSGLIRGAAANLGSAIIEGMIAGIGGLVGGLISAAINAAKSALDAAKNFLGINSPAKKAIPLGSGIGEGIALGLDNSRNLVNASAENLSQAALSAMSKTLNSLNDVVATNMDLQPTITPVIDLTQAKQGFDDLASMGGTVIPVTSAASAAALLAATKLLPKGPDEVNAGGTNLSFTQNITSPAVLPAITIYRQTKNQLSQAKGVLARANGG